MPEWLTGTFASDAELSFTLLLARLGASFALGCVVAGVYRFTHGRDGAQARALMATLVLLTVLICMMTLVIGNNVARAFSLVGALAIVRFRTVVEDTRDTAFVIFAVSVGMAVGAGFMKVPLVAIPVAALAAYLFRPAPADAFPPARPSDFELTLRTGAGLDVGPAVRDAMGAHIEWSRLQATGTARMGAVVETTYAVRLRAGSDGAALIGAMNALEGVQGVELRRV